MPRQLIVIASEAVEPAPVNMGEPSPSRKIAFKFSLN